MREEIKIEEITEIYMGSTQVFLSYWFSTLAAYEIIRGPFKLVSLGGGAWILAFLTLPVGE